MRQTELYIGWEQISHVVGFRKKTVQRLFRAAGIELPMYRKRVALVRSMKSILLYRLSESPGRISERVRRCLTENIRGSATQVQGVVAMQGLGVSADATRENQDAHKLKSPHHTHAKKDRTGPR